MKITFLGAAGTVTGSSFFVSDDRGAGILIDAGMFQGPSRLTDLNFRPLGVDPSDIRAVVLTHAHLDHCGRIPLLARLGYDGNVYMTEATWRLSELTLTDAAKVQRENDPMRMLFTEDDVASALKLGRKVSYGSTFTVDHWKITLRDAGHIMGSAFVEIEDTESPGGKKAVFSGDLGNYPEDLVRPTEHPGPADIVVMETTYGDHAHDKEPAADAIAQEIRTIEKSGGTLLVPAFTVERTQEILHLIDHLKKDGKVDNATQVFLDSPMAIKATRIYRGFREDFSNELKEHVRTDDPFMFPGLTLIEDRRESDAIDGITGPKVIIAGGGMMNGGRIMKHAASWLATPSTRLLFTGYQAEGTMGRAILEGAPHVRIGRTDVKVRANVRKVSSFSAHADQPKLLSWLSSVPRVSKVFLVHSENPVRAVFSDLVRKETDIKDIFLPALGETASV